MSYRPSFFSVAAPVVSVFLVTVVGLLAASALGGAILSLFWGWFVVPVFPGLPAFGVVPGFGLALFVGYMSPTKTGAPLALHINGVREEMTPGMSAFFVELVRHATVAIGYLIYKSLI